MIVKIVFLALALLINSLIAILLEKNVSDSFNNMLNTDDGIIDTETEEWRIDNREAISWHLAILWVVFFPFYIGAAFGRDIYNKIIDKYDEDRIASRLI